MLKAKHAKEILVMAKKLVEEEKALDEVIPVIKTYKPNDKKALVDRICKVKYTKDRLQCMIELYAEQIKNKKVKAHNGQKGGK